MQGFHRVMYEHNGEKKYMAATQFQPVDPRRCFPCWDEPAWKATFKIRLDDVPSELIALTNMPIIEEKVDGHLKTVLYEESPIMSTYLVAIVVGLFDYIEDHTSDGVKVRVYCQVGKANQGAFALNFAVSALEFYRDYFAVPYPLPKLDMVAIPDFFGAMENYGLVATVVAHELAHQWFGNLVTMEWWTDLWLNEAFASWVSLSSFVVLVILHAFRLKVLVLTSLGELFSYIDILFPEWKIWTQFLRIEVSGGLKLDGLEESHAIEVDINRASELHEIFDAICYDKGTSVVRMLQTYLGAECFQRSPASYIKKYASSNAKTEELMGCP
ncbi:hypothetical protein TB1_016191 [Malus domestica]